MVFNAAERPTIKFPMTNLCPASQIKELVDILMSFMYMYMDA